MSEPRTEAGKRLLLDCDDMDWLEMRERILAIEAEAAPHPLDGLREALTKIANPDHRTPGAECLWCMDDLPEHEDWCAATIARAALGDEGETT